MKNNKTNYFVLGLQFTSMILVPPLVCIFGGLYLQEKYGFGDDFMMICVAVAAILMFSSLFSFAKTSYKLAQKNGNRKENSGDEPEK